MFPLGMVLFPTMILPLRVFEPRYQLLVRTCLDSDLEFGVCLIERGSEVGGGDQRASVGTVAQIIDARQSDNGRWALATVGTRRIVVEQWLDDDPFPRAAVTDWRDPEPEGDLAPRRERVVQLLRSGLVLQAELNEPAPPANIEIDADATIASYQVSALSPVGAFDRHRLLSAPSVEARFDLLEALLAEEVEVLRQRLSLG